VANLSPSKAYLALSKHLLSFIHREDRKVPEGTRPYLQAHVARTYSATDRQEGAISAAQAIRDREGLLLKPCQYGGGHGVVIGRDTPKDEWAQRVEATFGDPGWALQEFYLPRRSPTGEYLSIGLYNYGGHFGGMTIRAAPSLMISARKSAFIPVALGS
jgi:hypothetical protein